MIFRVAAQIYIFPPTMYNGSTFAFLNFSLQEARVLVEQQPTRLVCGDSQVVITAYSAEWSP